MKLIVKARLIDTLPLKPWDYKEVECFSCVNIYHGENGHIYFNYVHSDWIYCPLHNIPIENCPYDDKTCQSCPDAKDFVVLDDQDTPIPVNRLT